MKNPRFLETIARCQPTAHRFAFSDSASLRVRQTRADSASLRFVPVMMSSHRGAPDSPLAPGGVESSVSYGRRPLRESLDIRALPPSRRPRPSRERQTGVTNRFPERRAEPTFLADEMSAPADLQVNDAVSEERTSGRSDALSVRNKRHELLEEAIHVHAFVVLLDQLLELLQKVCPIFVQLPSCRGPLGQDSREHRPAAPGR